jgi:hypothetical protein
MEDAVEALDGPSWAYRFLVVDLAADASDRAWTDALNRAWEEVAAELWSPTIISFQTVEVGDYVSLVILYRYDDTAEEDN